MTKECKQQFTLRITQANSTQLIVILYEMTLQYLADGEQAADDAGLAEAELSAQRIQPGRSAFQTVPVLPSQTCCM